MSLKGNTNGLGELKGSVASAGNIGGSVSVPKVIHGQTPYIKDGNWWIGEVDTGVKAEGVDGKDGKDGSVWHYGTSISGTGTILYPMKDAKGGDYYLNTNNGNVYIAEDSDSRSASAWRYVGNLKGVKGDKGDPGYTPVKGVDYFDGQDGKDGQDGFIVFEELTEAQKEELRGPQGIPGNDGADGVSPAISVSNITGGHRITITDKSGTKNVDVMDGEDGKSGSDGTNGSNGRGITSVTRTSGNGSAGTTDTYTIKYTDNTTSTFSVYNGKNGSDGASGKDGVSATHSWNGTTLTVTSASGTSSANLKGDTGAAGSNGKDGTSVTVTNVTTSSADGGSNVVEFSDGKTVTIKNGSKGAAGSAGSNGKDGSDGERGFSILRVTTAPSAYTTETGGFTPAYRIALSTVKSQASVDEVRVGDTILRNYYTYKVGYVDASYAYLTTYASIRGSAGAAGKDGATAEQVIAAMSTETWTFTLADGSTVTKVVPLI